MRITEINSNLCYYDKRNRGGYFDKYDTPEETKEKEEEVKEMKGETCYCDNCYYGRNALANEILRIINLEK